MKASERIEEIRQKLLADDWVAWAGNRYSKEEWNVINHMGTTRGQDYFNKALLQYLDETHRLFPFT